MWATTKYTAAPQHDPDEEHGYTQAPPSYQAESSSANDDELLLGAPRSSEDNVPDDFKVCLPCPSLSVSIYPGDQGPFALRNSSSNAIIPVRLLCR